MYSKGTPIGIIFGILLFIFCGFQHCIANIITLGVARTFDLSISLCIIVEYKKNVKYKSDLNGTGSMDRCLEGITYEEWLIELEKRENLEYLNQINRCH